MASNYLPINGAYCRHNPLTNLLILISSDIQVLVSGKVKSTITFNFDKRPALSEILKACPSSANQQNMFLFNTTFGGKSWAVPPPNKSHHQYNQMFSRGSQPKPSFATIASWEGGQPKVNPRFCTSL